MRLIELCDIELLYTSLTLIDYGAGGQIYGTMEGSASGERLSGQLSLTNLAARRPDNVNMPTLRGLLETGDGARLFVEMNGLAQLRSSDQARVFVTSLTFRTGAPKYAWLNGTLCILEGVLDAVAVGGTARGRAYECEATLGSSDT